MKKVLQYSLHGLSAKSSRGTVAGCKRSAGAKSAAAIAEEYYDVV